MKRETKLEYEQLRIVHHFLTSFDTRDTWVYETEKLLLSDVPRTTPAPRLSDLKQAQLHTNFRRFVLPKFKYKMCPKPPDLLIEKFNIQRKKKNKVRKDNKKTQDGNISNEVSVLAVSKNKM